MMFKTKHILLKKLLDAHNFMVSYLQFVDDTLILGEKYWVNIMVIEAIWFLVELVLGLKVNVYKSMLVGINVNPSWLVGAVGVLNCRVRKTSFKYLGIFIWGLYN